MIYHGINGLDLADDRDDLDSALPGPPPPTGLTDAASADFLYFLGMDKHLSVPPELGKSLIDIFFCHQVLAIVDRSVFLRDMALEGPFFSQFLLSCIYLTASAFIDGIEPPTRTQLADASSALARDMLTLELQGPTKISTAQGLLLLSVRESDLGRISQSWNYAGLVGCRRGGNMRS